jgi:hypothetical protein
VFNTSLIIAFVVLIAPLIGGFIIYLMMPEDSMKKDTKQVSTFSARDEAYHEMTITEYLKRGENGGYLLQAKVLKDDESETASQNNTIKIEGIWNKEIISVRFTTMPGLEHANEMEEIGYQGINGLESVQSGYNETGWHLAFHSISDKAGRSPMHLIVDTGTYDIAPDVNVLFVGNPSEKFETYEVLAKTKLRIASNGTLVSAEVLMYESDTFYEEGILMPLLLHELGHSLGLGHSNSEKSIMYPNVQVVNGHVIGEIGICEIAALNAMYFEDDELRTVGCNNENDAD